jgi:bacteriocin-like protein
MIELSKEQLNSISGGIDYGGPHCTLRSVAVDSAAQLWNGLSDSYKSELNFAEGMKVFIDMVSYYYNKFCAT